MAEIWMELRTRLRTAGVKSAPIVAP